VSYLAAGADLRGASRLIVDGVVGVTGIVESMHRNIAELAPIVGTSREGAMRGITGLVYRSVRGVTRVVGTGLDVALAMLPSGSAHADASPRREAVVAALNGVVGDHLASSGNPLAIPMRLRHGGRPLSLTRTHLREVIAAPTPRIVVLVHGLCMNDRQWQRDGHDHGVALASALGYTPLYLHYNSGRRIGANGRELAALLERLCKVWPVPVRELVIVGHSMGGLVARSACCYAGVDGHAWTRRLRGLVFLGTPHHGAPLERAGGGIDAILGASPYTAPFARLGRIRSSGVQDLRHGTLLDEDVPAQGARGGHARTPVPLPQGVPCFAVAATREAQVGREAGRVRGDGLVPVRSALGQHADAARALRIPASRRAVFAGHTHFDLLGSRLVYARMERWLAGE